MKKLLSLTTAILMILSVMMTGAFASEGVFEPLSNGSRDTQTDTRVARMQKKLIELGFLNSKADGRFGPVTEKALRAFQTANGLTADGVYNEDDDGLLVAGNPKNAKGTTGAVTTSATQKTTSAQQKASGTSAQKTTTTRSNHTPDNTRNTPDNTRRNTPDNTRNMPDNTRNTPDNTRDNS